MPGPGWSTALALAGGCARVRFRFDGRGHTRPHVLVLSLGLPSLLALSTLRWPVVLFPLQSCWLRLVPQGGERGVFLTSGRRHPGLRTKPNSPVARGPSRLLADATPFRPFREVNALAQRLHSFAFRCSCLGGPWVVGQRPSRRPAYRPPNCGREPYHGLSVVAAWPGHAARHRAGRDPRLFPRSLSAWPRG